MSRRVTQDDCLLVEGGAAGCCTSAEYTIEKLKGILGLNKQRFIKFEKRAQQIGSVLVTHHTETQGARTTTLALSHNRDRS